jgi:antitoxin component YwqK of YwqJK toxin-antitoxin module
MAFPESGPGVVGQEENRMKERIDRHKNGAIKAKGHTVDDVLTGYWEWFRKDGSKMRSGHFENGKQVGEWTTYDAKGKIVKVTKMKS